MERPTFRFEDDGQFPNNQRYDVVLCRGIHVEDPDQVMEFLRQRGWTGAWVNGIYDFPHYHSTAHEVLVCIQGTAEVRLGADAGQTFTLKKGDAALLPAGTAHQKLSGSPDFQVVGAYPEGQSFDMMYGKEGERPGADRRIEELPPPGPEPF